MSIFVYDRDLFIAQASEILGYVEECQALLDKDPQNELLIQKRLNALRMFNLLNDFHVALRQCVKDR